MKCEQHIIPPEFKWLSDANVIGSSIGAITKCDKCDKYLHVWHKYDEDTVMTDNPQYKIVGRELSTDEEAKILLLDLKPPVVFLHKDA